MVEHGDDAAHCSNGLTAQKFRDASGEERVIYRRWMRGHHRNAVPDRGRHAVDELFQCQPDPALEPVKIHLPARARAPISGAGPIARS